MNRPRTLVRLFTLATLLVRPLAATATADEARARTRPLFRDFMGLNVHTVQFKPMLYRPITRLVRDIRLVERAMGDGTKRVYPSEIAVLKKLRRVGAAV